MKRAATTVRSDRGPSGDLPDPIRPPVRAAAILTALFVAGTVPTACAGPSPTPARPRIPLPTAAVTPAPAFAADVENGARVFGAHCERCHGAGGAGDGPLAPGLSPRPPDWTRAGALRDRAPSQLFTSIRRGVLGSSMKRFDTVLDEASTWDVVFYLFTLPADVRDRAAAGEAFRRSCAGCHGADGAGLVPDAPPLARPDWAVRSRDALAARVAAAHPAAANASGADARLAAERIWDWLVAAPPAGATGATANPPGWTGDAASTPAP